MENDRHGEGRPPLLRRWVLLSCKSQTVKDSLCLAMFAMTLQILSGQYLFVAILIALELGLLAVLDYRDWVEQQVSPRKLIRTSFSRTREGGLGAASDAVTNAYVIHPPRRNSSQLVMHAIRIAIYPQRLIHTRPPLLYPQVKWEATRVDPVVSVSPSLLFSPQGLQDQYHKWMFQIPAVRELPWLSVFTQLMFCVRFLIVKPEYECGWVHVAAHLPGTALAAARLVLTRIPSEFQSLLSVLAWAYLLAHMCVFKAFNDTCWMNMAADLPGNTSLSGYACITIATSAMCLSLAPCTMHHLDAMLWIAGLGNGSANYIVYLQNNGGPTFDSDPDLSGFQTVAAAMSVCLLVAAAIRYWLARKHMTGFLRSIRTRRQHRIERAERPHQ